MAHIAAANGLGNLVAGEILACVLWDNDEDQKLAEDVL